MARCLASHHRTAHSLPETLAALGQEQESQSTRR